MQEQHYLEELRNIFQNAPVFPGDTISHAGANECVARGWAERDAQGYFVPTAVGSYIAQQSMMINDLREAMQSLRVSNEQAWKIIESSRAASRDMYQRIERLRLLATIRGFASDGDRLNEMREVLREPIPTGTAGGEYCPPAPKQEPRT